MYRKTEGGKDIELSEVGPRFEMKSKLTRCSLLHVRPQNCVGEILVTVT